MKPDVNAILNKLITYAEDNLMLDSLDESYTLNRLAGLAGVVPALDPADYGDATFGELLGELTAAVPGIDTTAVTDALMPLPHTVNYYFTDELNRNREKAFAFIFDIFAASGAVAAGKASVSNGFVRYTAADVRAPRSVTLSVGGEELIYTPLYEANRIAALECNDILSEDITSRMAAFAEQYGGAIVKRVGGDGDYLCCSTVALSSAAVKQKLSDGVVKTAVVDYPVPALSLSGPKNSAAREAARVIKAAADTGLSCVVACTPGEWLTFYVVFAGDLARTDLFAAGDALTACGVFGTADFSPLLPVLEKGTALSTDLFVFKPVYTAIGGVKHGKKAEAALDGEVVKAFIAALASASSADVAKATDLVKGI